MNKSHKLDQRMKLQLLNAIANDYDGKPTNEHLINLAKGRFNVEMGWRVEQVGRQKAARDWLQGLALSVDFYNYDICLLMIRWCGLTEDFTKDEEYKAIEQYWDAMPTKLLQLFDGYHVPKQEVN